MKLSIPISKTNFSTCTAMSTSAPRHYSPQSFYTQQKMMWRLASKAARELFDVILHVICIQSRRSGNVFPRRIRVTAQTSSRCRKTGKLTVIRYCAHYERGKHKTRMDVTILGENGRKVIQRSICRSGGMGICFLLHVKKWTCLVIPKGCLSIHSLLTTYI